MVEANRRSTRNQYNEQVPVSSQDDSKKEVLPHNRKPKCMWKIVCILVSVGVIAYALIDYKNVEYHPDKDFCNKTSTGVCYQKVEKISFHRLISFGLVLFGVCVSRLCDCLFNVCEELRQFKSRYNRDICKVFKKCFSGTKINVMFGVALLVGLPCFAVKLFIFSFTPGDGMLIAGSFGVVRLLLWLLFDPNSVSEADRSRDREKSGRHPIDGIAWSFCVNLNKDLPMFKKLFTDSTMPVQDQEGPTGVSDRDLQPKIPIDLNKMILLFSHNYEESVNLGELDNHIRKIPINKREDGYEFPVYGLWYKGREYKYVIRYAEDPLKTLKEMCGRIPKDEFKEQVQLLYRAVDNIINEHYCNHKNRCILMLMTEAENLENGGLVARIMSCVHGQPLETGDVSKANFVELTGRSHVINMSEIEGKVHLKKRVGNESTALLGEEELDSASTNDKPLSRKYRTANKSKQGERKSHSAETAGLLYDPDEKARGNTEEQRISSLFEHIEENDKAKTTPPMFRQKNESPDSQKHSEMKEVDQLPMPRTSDEVIAQGLDHDVQKLKMEKSPEERRAKENGEEEIRPPPPGERKRLQQPSSDMNSTTPDISRKLPAQSNDITVMKDDEISSEENCEEILSTSRNLSLSGRDFLEDGTYDLDGVEQEERRDKDDKETESVRAGERNQHTSSNLVAKGKSHLKTVKSEERVDVGDDKATMQDDVESKEDECKEETEAQRMSVIQFANRVEKLPEKYMVGL